MPGIVTHSEIDPGTYRSPGPDDPVWDAVPWLAELRNVPPDATWPRLMTLPHPEAVGSYGAELVEQFRARHQGRDMRWWQKLSAYRILEHRADGTLVWPEYLATLSRQGGKSWELRELALWRMNQGPRWGDQLVLHTGKDLGIVREVLKPAQSWGQVNGLCVSRNNLEPGLSTGEHMTGSRWVIKAKDAVYGYSATNALVDEGWDVPARVVHEGVEPTMVEQVSPQLGLWSTAHRKATGLMLERRRDALEELNAPKRRLLLEWSTPTDMDRADPAGWRMASPHWSDQRAELIAAAYARVLRGESVDPEEPDPIASFDAQWLNRWPGVIRLQAPEKNERLADDGEWQACRDDAAAPAPGRPVFAAVEDDLGRGAAAAAAALTPDGRVVLGGYRFASLREAVDWAQDTAEGSLDGLLLVGASVFGDPELEGLDVPVESAGGAEFRDALPTLRALVRGGRVAHDGAEDATRAVVTARVRPNAGSAAMLLAECDHPALLRCLAWVVQRAHRDRE